MTGRVAGRVAIVSGGASGIGRSSAIRLAAEGATVMVTDIDEDMGSETVAPVSYTHLTLPTNREV